MILVEIRVELVIEIHWHEDLELFFLLVAVVVAVVEIAI